MISRALRYGGLIALAVALWTLLEFALGFHGPRAEVGRYTGFLAIAFPVAGISLALREERRSRGGELSFLQGLALGTATAAVLSVLGAAFIWGYFVFINPEFEAAGRAAEPMEQAALLLASSFVAGVIISAVAALALRGGSARAAA